MRYIRLLFFLFLFSFWPIMSFGGNDIGGLIFRAYNYSKDERTSMIIPAKEQQLRMKNYFSLSFKLKIQEEGEHFGYICRIIIGNQKNINLMLVNPVNEAPYLCFIKDQQYLGKIQMAPPVDIYRWNTIKIETEIANDTLYVKGNGVVLTKDANYPDDRTVRICFGANDFIPYSTSDVAPMIIKDIEVGLKQHSFDYVWPLREAVLDTLLDDENRKLKAYIANSDWVISQHLHWQRIRTIKFSSKTFPVSDSANNLLYFVSEDRVTKVHLISNKVEEFLYTSPIDVDRLTNQFIAFTDKEQGSRLAFYDFEKPDEQILSFFNFETGEWSIPVRRERQSSYTQHNRFYSWRDSSIVQLFGYGFHQYKRELNRISLTGKVVRSELSNVITPRYLSAIGVKDSIVFIYGGLGNKVGKQEYGVTGYRDLYTLHLKDYSLHKEWSLPLKESNEVIASSLVVDSTCHSAKGLFFCPGRFLSKMVMKSLNLSTGEEEVVGDTIPYTFLDVSSHADLLYLASEKQYIAVTVHQVDGHVYEANIYLIAAPVLPILPPKAEDKKWFGLSEWVGLIAIVTLVIFIGRQAYMRRRNKEMNTHLGQEEADEVDKEVGTEPEIEILVDKPMNSVLNTTPGIYMLNGFQVINKDSEDITGKFTPIMRQLLSVIILYSCYNRKGISNVKLKELLWFDKSEESFSNNRSVNIRKIRLLLEEVGDTEISSANGYWYFSNRGEVYNDYMLAMQMMNKMTPQSVMTDGDMKTLLQLAGASQLLPNMQFDWVDNFKAEYSDSMIGLLSKMRDSKQFENDQKMKVMLSNRILRFDSLDEESVRVKCRSLVELKRLGMAHTAFDSFVKEYRLILNEDFKESFEQFIRL